MATWLSIDDRRIADLSDEELRVLARELIWASAHVAGCEARLVRVNTEIKAGDGGGDAYTPTPTKPEPWLGDAETCFQLKSGRASEPAQLDGEIAKRVPSEVLARGGRYVLLASGCTGDTAGRKAALVAQASKLGLPTDKIEVYAADQIALWVAARPSAALGLAGISDAGIYGVETWPNLPPHDVPYTAVPSTSASVDALRAFLDRDHADDSAATVCFIDGQHGAGKTRLVLEAAKTADAKHLTVYLPEATTDRIRELGTYVRHRGNALMNVIADEALDPALVSAALQVAKVAGHRIRFALIGPTLPPEYQHTPGIVRLRAAPLSPKELSPIVAGWFPGILPEHVDYVAALSEGNVRLARMIAEAVDRDGAQSTIEILRRGDVGALMREMLGDADSAALQVVAVADSIGWTDDAEAEGRAVCDAFGLLWGDVRQRVADADRRYGLARPAGKRRYISPTPLGLYLATHAWETFPNELRGLLETLPEPGRTKLLERFEDLGRHPVAQRIAREEVERFRTLDDFRSVGRVKLWRAIANVESEVALTRLRDALAAASVSERKALDADARRELVWALDPMSWTARNFVPSAECLAYLAEAENEEYANNATGILRARYQVYLGGTSVPYPARIDVLRTLWSRGSGAMRGVVLAALSVVGNVQSGRMDSGATRRNVVEEEWRPRRRADLDQAVSAALDLWREVTDETPDELASGLVSAIGASRSLLHAPVFRDAMADICARSAQRFPAQREAIRRLVREALDFDSSRDDEEWKDWSQEAREGHLAALTALHESLRDASMLGRLQEVAGAISFEDRETRMAPMDALAREVVAAPEMLGRDCLAWLVSGDAAGAWDFAWSLGTADRERLLLLDAIWVASATGSDSRLIAGYLNGAASSRGPGWLDDEIDRRLVGGMPGQLVFQATVRSEGTARGAARVMKLVEAGLTPGVVGLVQYGTWADQIEEADFTRLVRALMREQDTQNTALVMLSHRVRRAKALHGSTTIDLALEMLKTPGLLRRAHTSGWHWAELAKAVLPTHAVAIATAILDAHTDRGGDSRAWFIEYSSAKQTLLEAVKADPSRVWEVIAARLETHGYAAAIGFPEEVVALVPKGVFADWVRGDVRTRASLASRLVPMHLEDDSLVAALIEAFGSDAHVASSFAAAYCSGSWTGPASKHFESLREAALQRATETALPRFRAWLETMARELEADVAREREREAEEEILMR